MGKYVIMKRFMENHSEAYLYPLLLATLLHAPTYTNSEQKSLSTCFMQSKAYSDD